MRRIRNFVSMSLILSASSATLGQTRIFLVEEGANPVDTPTEGSVVETYAGAVITFELFVEDVNYPLRLNGVQATVPCLAACSGGGMVSYINHEGICCHGWLPYHCFTGRFCDSGTEIGTLCFANNTTECPGGDAAPCPLPQSCLCIPDVPYCPEGPGPRIAVAHGTTQAAIVLEDDPPFPPGGTFNGGRCGFGTVTYQLSPDARGDCLIAIPNEPETAIRDQDNQPIPFTTSPITVRVPVGACCSPGVGCIDNATHAECQSMAHSGCAIWSRDANCRSSPCGCTSDACCSDANACSCDTCLTGSCSHAVRAFGDADCSGGVVNMDDILCSLEGFRNRENCPNADLAPTCTGDGRITLDDILQVIVGFSGSDPCACE